MVFLVLLACFVVVNGDGIMTHDQPQPYKFGYTIKDKGGVQSRAEAGNGAGVVEGNYAIIDNKGLHRQVNYVADHAGFRAAIKTNEPGTAGQSPAAVHMMSNDPYAHGAAVPYVSRVNDPVVPAMYESDGVYGFPTIHGSYAPVHGAAYGRAPYAPVLGHGPVNGALGYGPGYFGGLAHSNLLGAGYRDQGGIVNYGANLIGGHVRGFYSRFANL